MARRGKKTSPAEDLIDLIARAPWWVGVLLAAISYPMLHAVASTPFQVSPGRVGDSLLPMMLRGLAQGGQFIVPLVCLAGAGVSIWRRRQRRELLERAVASPGLDAIAGMSWREFELLIGQAYRREGYAVVETGGGGADGGVDLVLKRASTTGTEQVLVQCKHWKAQRVGVTIVRELYGVMAARGAARGVVVTGGRYTDEAKQFAEGRNVQLIDGKGLAAMLADARRAMDPASAPPASTKVIDDSSAGDGTTRPAEDSSCPRCSKPLARRVARRGANEGQPFWGCTGFPACRFTTT